jgi:hypothetical protein
MYMAAKTYIHTKLTTQGADSMLQCVFIYMYICKYTHTHTFSQNKDAESIIYICVYIYECMYTCLYTHAHIHAHTNYNHIYEHTNIHTYILTAKGAKSRIRELDITRIACASLHGQSACNVQQRSKSACNVQQRSKRLQRATTVNCIHTYIHT